MAGMVLTDACEEGGRYRIVLGTYKKPHCLQYAPPHMQYSYDSSSPACTQLSGRDAATLYKIGY